MSSVSSGERPCVKCGSGMAMGFTLDNAYGERLQSAWIEGAPEYSRWSGMKVKGKIQIPIVTFRCVQCGYLESYALPA